MLRNRGNESRAVAECVRQSWEQRERCEGAEKAAPGNGTSAHQFVYTVDESSHSPYRAGDVVAARGQARRVLLESPSPADAAQAQDLIDRTETPRAAFYFALLAALA